MTREAHSHVYYTVRQLPGMVQFSTDAREDALRLAMGFGQTHGVDVWYEDGRAYQLLAAHRPPPVPGAAVDSANRQKRAV